MNDKREKMLLGYINTLYESNQNYSTIGRKIKYVSEFLENVEELNKRGYLRYKKENVEKMSCSIGMSDAILDFMAYIGVGHCRRQKKIKPLEKLSAISEKNKKLCNDFLNWILENNDYSNSTVELYRSSMKFFFEYANDFNMDNCRRFIRMMEEKEYSPKTIRLRITVFEKFSKWIKKPLELKRPKIKKSLSVENIPTEEEYYRLLDFLRKKKNKDYYFFIRILGTTGVRLSEFLKITWEDIEKGDTVICGKGNKYRHVFFTKELRKEVTNYMREYKKTGIVAITRFGNPFSQRGLSIIMKDWGDSCNIIRSKMHPHAFRHFFAKMFLKKNKDVIQLADLLGHGSIDTTRIYLQRTYEEQKRDFTRNVTW